MDVTLAAVYRVPPTIGDSRKSTKYSQKAVQVRIVGLDFGDKVPLVRAICACIFAGTING